MKKLVSFIVLLSIPLLLEAAGSRQGVLARFKEGVNNKRTAVKNEYTAIRNDRKNRTLEKRQEVEKRLKENAAEQKKIRQEAEKKQTAYNEKKPNHEEFLKRSSEIEADGKELRSLLKESAKLQKDLEKLDRQDKFNNSKISGFVDGVKVALRVTGRGVATGAQRVGSGIASAGSGVAKGAQRVGGAVAAPVSKFGRAVSKQYNQNQARRDLETLLAINPSSSPHSPLLSLIPNRPSTTFSSKVVDAVVAPFQVSGRGIASAGRRAAVVGESASAVARIAGGVVRDGVANFGNKVRQKLNDGRLAIRNGLDRYTGNRRNSKPEEIEMQKASSSGSLSKSTENIQGSNYRDSI